MSTADLKTAWREINKNNKIEWESFLTSMERLSNKKLSKVLPTCYDFKNYLEYFVYKNKTNQYNTIRIKFTKYNYSDWAKELITN